jgi:hypothetical protein
VNDVPRHDDARLHGHENGPAEVAEVPFLLSAGLLEALEGAASRRGLTAGQLLRHLVQDFLLRPEGNRPPYGGVA